MTDAPPPWDGVPLHPERDGRHWLLYRDEPDAKPFPALWLAEYAAWADGGMHSPQGVVDLGLSYLGPCLMPTEAAALAEAAAVEMRTAASQAARSALRLKPDGSAPTADELAAIMDVNDAIMSLPLAAPNLDAIRAETDRLREAIRRIHRAPVYVDRIPAKGITEELIAAIIEAAELAGPGEATSADQPEPIQAINTLGRITEALGVPWDATASRILEVISAKQAEERQKAFAEAIEAVERHGEKLTAAWRSDGKRSQHLEGKADAEDEYIGAIRAAMFRGFAALPAPEDWRKVLFIAPFEKPTIEDAERAYRAMARGAHPDHPGGSHDAMARLNRAIEAARKELGHA